MYHSYTRGNIGRIVVRPGTPSAFDSVKARRKGSVDGAAEPEEWASQKPYLEARKDREHWRKVCAKLTSQPRNLRPRLIRPESTQPGQLTASTPTEAVSEPKATRGPRGIYDRHGLTSRGVKLSATLGAFLRKGLQERTVPGATIYPPLPTQGTQFYRHKAEK